MSPAGTIVLILGLLIGVLSVAALLIWVERRGLALLQDRLGPNRVGPLGLGQPLADMVKIMLKEDWIPPQADRAVFVLAPMLVLGGTLATFAVVAVGPGLAIADLNVGLLAFLALSSLGVYGVTLAGWSSNNKYSLLGALRAASQMVSYEVFMGLALAGVVLMAGSFNLTEIVEAQRRVWFCVPQAAGLAIFLVAALAETRRLPFDLPEAENELVAGYHVEYSGMKFAMFFVGEYVGITLIAALVTTFYLGGWLGPWLPPVAWFLIKTAAVVCGFIVLRAAVPRPRFDQVTTLGWQVCLPLALANLLATGGVLLALE
jgi:NADH-quinone oxidoreductase subunit H